MSKPKRVDADRLIRQYYEGEDTEEGAFPDDTMEPLSSVPPRSADAAAPDATLSGGDVDASRNGTDAGEEAVGGSSPTPDQDIVEELGKAAGITYEDAEPLRFGDKMADRDAQRWELNPASSEGYQERLQELTSRQTGTPKRPQSKRLKQAGKAGQSASGRGRVGVRKTQKKKR